MSKRGGTSLSVAETMKAYEDCHICQADGSALRSTDLPASDPSWPVINTADLFSGCGGLSLGIQRAAYGSGYSLDVRLALDSDQVAMDVYHDLFPTATTICQPIEEVLDGEIGSNLTRSEADLAHEVGHLDFMLGGPPCQGHSNLNNHSRRDDPRNVLYLRMARAAQVFWPSAIIIENVPTVTYDVQKAVHRTIDCLKSLEYTVGARVIDLSNLGVPQRRRRHIILALRDCEIDPQELIDSLDSPVCGHVPRTVRWAIGDLEDGTIADIFDSASTPYPVNQSRIDWLFEKTKPTCRTS